MTTEGKVEYVVDSREVAEMLGKDHPTLLRDINGSKDGKHIGIIPTLRKSQLAVSKYFLESSYKSGKGTYKNYLITKMGCELLANKMTGEKGILFTATYVQAFNDMEQQLLQQNDVKVITGMEQVVNQLQEKIDTLSKYCKINCSLKHQFIEYIKKRLGIRVTNSEYEQVKARIFLVLGVTKWEEIDFELKEKVLNLIDESIKIIKSERPYEQRTFWD